MQSPRNRNHSLSVGFIPKGTTEVGKNIREIRRDSSGGWGPTADPLLEHTPPEVVDEAVDEAADAADLHHQHDPADDTAGKITVDEPLDPHVIHGDKDDRGPAVSAVAPSEKIFQEAVAEIKESWPAKIATKIATGAV